MITRLEVDGFKSLSNFAIDFEPFTALIGPNSAGKSNILEAITLLSRLAWQPIAEAIKGGRGRSIDQFTRRGGEPAKEMRFAVELFVHHIHLPPRPAEPGTEISQNRFRYELTLERQVHRSGVERIALKTERLKAMRRQDDTWMRAHPEFTAIAGYEDAGEDTFFTMEDATSGKLRVIGLPSHWPEERSRPETHTFLAGSHYSDAHWVGGDLSACRLLQLDATRLREPSERVDSGQLAQDASNLPTVLADLPAPLLGEIRADLVSLVPGIASFDVVPEGETFHIEFVLSGGERLPARLVSDGTLRILALLTALRAEPQPSWVCIEELENGIYPGRLRAMVHFLREISERHPDESTLAERLENARRELEGINVGIDTAALPTQILLTTHSPVILAALRNRPQHLRFIDIVRRGGERVTRARPVGRPGASDRGRLTVSPREIDVLLDTATAEETE
jgi:predicted ATPase